MAELKRVRESSSSDEATPATSQQQEHQQQPSAAAVVTAPAPNLSRRRVCPVGGSLHKSVNQYLYKSSAVKHAAAVQLGQRRSIFPTGCVWVLHQPTYAWDCQLTLYILAVTCRLAEQDTAEEALQLLQEHEGRLLEVLVVGTSVLTATATAARLSFSYDLTHSLPSQLILPVCQPMQEYNKLCPPNNTDPTLHKEAVTKLRSRDEFKDVLAPTVERGGLVVAQLDCCLLLWLLAAETCSNSNVQPAVSNCTTGVCHST